MELAFATKKLREICESDILALHHFTVDIVSILKIRLADLRAISSIHELPTGDPAPIIYFEQNCMEIALISNENIIVKANHNSNPILDNGDLDWSRISRIKIMCIGEIQ